MAGPFVWGLQEEGTFQLSSEGFIQAKRKVEQSSWLIQGTKGDVVEGEIGESGGGQIM